MEKLDQAALVDSVLSALKIRESEAKIIDRLMTRFSGAELNKRKKTMEVLSQFEIDALLAGVDDSNDDPCDLRPACPTKKIKIYDFRCPDVVSKTDLKASAYVHERAATTFSQSIRRIDPSFSAILASVDQLPLYTLLQQIKNPSFSEAYKLGLHGEGCWSGPVLVMIDTALSAAIVDKFAQGTLSDAEWWPTKISEKVLSHFVKLLMDATRASWKKELFKDATLDRIEVDWPTSVMSHGDVGMLVQFEVKVESTEGMVNAFYSATALEPFKKLTQANGDPGIFELLTKSTKPFKVYGPTGESEISALASVVDDAEVELRAEVFRKRFTVREIVETLAAKGTFKFDNKLNELRLGDATKFYFSVAVDQTGTKQRTIKIIKEGGSK